MKSILIDDEFLEDEPGDETQDVVEEKAGGKTEKDAKLARRLIEILREQRDLKAALDDIFDEDI